MIYVMKRRSAVASAALLLLSGTGSALASGPQTTAAVQEGLQTLEGIPATKATAASAKPDLLIVPIPQVSPAIGTGVTLGGGLFYNPNGSKEPWITGGALMATSNGSWAVGAGHKMAWAKDRFRLTAFAGYGDVNLRFYGVGPVAGELNQSVDINDQGVVAFVDPQMRVAPNLYIGVRALFLDLKIRLRRNQDNPSGIELPERDADSRLVQTGPVLVYDSRDNSLTPHNGIYAQASWLFGLPGLGSDFANDRVNLFANIYRSVGPKTVFAARVSTCAASRGSPFYDICLYGASSDLRGYEAGRFRDNASWATQAEIRQGLKGRFGIAAFAGVGGIAPSFGDLGESKILPAAGVGLRWQASKQTPINLRIDYAVGRDSNALYVSVGEAF